HGDLGDSAPFGVMPPFGVLPPAGISQPAGAPPPAQVSGLPPLGVTPPPPFGVMPPSGAGLALAPPPPGVAVPSGTWPPQSDVVNSPSAVSAGANGASPNSSSAMFFPGIPQDAPPAVPLPTAEAPEGRSPDSSPSTTAPFMPAAPLAPFMSVSPPANFTPAATPAPFMSVSPPANFTPAAPPAPFMSVSPPANFTPEAAPAPFMSVSPPVNFTPAAPPAPFMSVSRQPDSMPVTTPAPFMSVSTPLDSTPATTPAPFMAISKPAPFMSVSAAADSIPAAPPAPSMSVSTPEPFMPISTPAPPMSSHAQPAVAATTPDVLPAAATTAPSSLFSSSPQIGEGGADWAPVAALEAFGPVTGQGPGAAGHPPVMAPVLPGVVPVSQPPWSSTQAGLGGGQVSCGQSGGSSLRPPCVVMAFSVDGKLLRAAPNGVAQELAVADLLKQNLKDWHADLESFPGPFGRVDSSTTEALLRHLNNLGDRFEESNVKHCTLESAVNHPHSAAMACRFLASLLQANGRVQSEEFWKHFGPALSKRASCLRPAGQPTALQEFCARLACGEASAALEDACVAGLWPHALAVSRIVAPASWDRVLLQFGSSFGARDRGSQQESGPLSEQELADPAVKAVLLLYETVGKGSVPEISPSVLAGWPAFVAVFALLLRPCEQRGLALTFIETLAARLAASGDIFGAHVCYLLTGERTLEAVDAPSSLVCLIGVEHRSPKNFSRLLEPLALQLSEAFEYAIRCGNSDALCPTLQPFKLAHAMLLADAGLTDKARRYMTLLQAFVKAVPQNRLSDAFRSSMREFNELLNPNLATGGQTEGPKVGKMVKDIWRGFAETTGFASKAIAPPALSGDVDEPKGARPAYGSPASGYGAPSTASFGPPQPPLQTPLLAGAGGPFNNSFAGPSSGGPGAFAPGPFAAGAAMQPPSFAATPVSPVSRYPAAPFLGGAPAMGPGHEVQAPAMPPAAFPSGPCGGCGPYNGYSGNGSFGNGLDSFGAGGAENLGAPMNLEAKKPPDRMDYSETMDADPLLSAGKAVFGFGKSLFSAIKGGGNEPKGGSGTEKADNGFFFDKEKGQWRQRGVDNEPDASAYDPMTGKKLTPKVTEPPPPPPPMMGGGPPMAGGMGAPPMGGNPYAGGGLGRGAGAAALYVNPLASGPPMGGMAGGPPMGGMGAPMGGMGGGPQMGGMGGGMPMGGMGGPPAMGGMGGGPPMGGMSGGPLQSSPFGGQQGMA
ncbi:unnamed protein product, partial [Polarella glacialis]